MRRFARAGRVRWSSGALLAASSAVAYGSLAVLAKIAYVEGWNVPSLLAARFTIAALTILPIALYVGGGSWRAFGGGLLVGGVGYAGTTALYFPSLLYLPAAVSSFLLYLAPAIVALFSWMLLRERLGRIGWIAVGISLAGLAILTSGALTGELSLQGVALAAGSAVVYAGTVIASRKLVADAPWAFSGFSVSVGAALTYIVVATATGTFEIPRGSVAIASAIGIGTLATGVALSLFFIALARIGASRTAVIATLEPVSTLVIAAIVLGESPGATGLIGGLVILVAAALVANEKGEELAVVPQE